MMYQEAIHLSDITKYNEEKQKSIQWHQSLDHDETVTRLNLTTFEGDPLFERLDARENMLRDVAEINSEIIANEIKNI